jgi:hypothetical protein
MKADRVIAAFRSGAFGMAVLASGAADAQTRAECEAGIDFIGRSLSGSTDIKQRGTLEKALRDARRELDEEEYDECLEAVEDARDALRGGTPDRASLFRADERLATDAALPVTVESAFLPNPGETEATLGLVYDRVRRTPREGGDDDEEAGSNGRHRFTPLAEIEHGFTRELSGSFGLAYRRGTTEDDLTGEAELGAKWNLSSPQELLPALTLSASVAAPFGFDNGGTWETTIALLASKPLGNGADAPYLHANLFWTHAYDRGEDDRANRFGAILGLAAPVAESTAIVVDVLHEQDEAKGAITNLAELGVRQLLPGDAVLGLGAGVGFGGSTTDFRVLLGVQKSF